MCSNTSNMLVLIELGDAMRICGTCIIHVRQELGVTDLSQVFTSWCHQKLGGMDLSEVTVTHSSVQVPAN